MKSETVSGLLPATIDGKEVKNLGWLLRHWQTVTSFVINEHPPVSSGFQPDAVLIANMRNGSVYQTGFSCSRILLDWLDRPVFRGVPQTWNLAKPE